MDMGAYVVVVNAEQVRLGSKFWLPCTVALGLASVLGVSFWHSCVQVTVTGTKFDDKTYFKHVNGRPGSYRVETFKDLQRVREAPTELWACWR
jgi:ribosomal protein L13